MQFRIAVQNPRYLFYFCNAESAGSCWSVGGLFFELTVIFNAAVALLEITIFAFAANCSTKFLHTAFDSVITFHKT